MKSILIFIFCFSTIDFSAASNPKVAEFLESNAEKAATLLEMGPGTGLRSEMISAAIEAHRLELIEFCFNSSSAWDLVPEAVAKLPDSDYKDQLVIMMLKSESHYWPRNEPFQDGSHPGMNGYLDEPITGILRKYIPDLPMEVTLIESHESRSKLATTLQAAIDKKDQSSTKERARQEKLTEPSPSTPGVSEENPATSSGGNREAVPDRKSWANPLTVAMVALVTLLLLGLAFKRRG